VANDTHAFISYAHADQEWVRVLAENLHRSGIDLFYDEWEIGAGDVLVHKLDQGILTTRNGVIVVSPTALSRPWVQEEYAAMMTRAVAGQQRVIPVLLKDAELPPFLAARVYVDFRNADGPVYFQRVEELVRALKGERRGPPPRDGGPLKPPPGTGFRPEGKIAAGLRIGDGEAVLSGGGGEVRAPISGLGASLEQVLWEQQRALRRATALRDTEVGTIDPVLGKLGARLADAFLPTDIATALDAEVSRAVQNNASLELALELLDEAFADLPWEALHLSSGKALALHPRLDLYRRVLEQGPSPSISIPGPLRILVAIGSPESQNARGELLDMEKELQIILNAIEPARRTGRAMIRVLERGSIQAIRAALDQQRYHVLYISCHAAPGRLILEDADGGEDQVDAGRFWRDALPANRGVPLVVLAGCSTAREGAVDAGAETERRLPSLARELVARGVPSVIAMQAPVSDSYATDLAGALFQALASWQVPEPLHALAEARRRLERKRLEDTSPRQLPPEWPTPTLYAAKSPLPLYDPTAPFEELKPPPEPVLDKGVVVRRVGEFVGRRREERLALKHLRDEDGVGVLLHGIGGVGKSTLAAQVLHRLADDGRLLISLSGPVDCDQILGEIGQRLFELCLAEGRDERDPLRQIANYAREPKESWENRLNMLIRQVFANLPLIFLFDNFEDNLDAERRVRGDLADLLAAWLEQPGKSRLLFTCRHPFQLPDDAGAWLDELHLGPLSPAETRKLMLRLPGLGALQPDELQRAYEEVGGHPRALEYLDALLRGEARFDDVEKRLKKALQARGVNDPSKWRADTEGGLDAALAETATLAADDVLLDALLQQLKPSPLARKLLFGAAVCRVPVDRAGLAYQVGKIVERPEDPERQQRMARVREALDEARAAGKPVRFRSVVVAAEALGVPGAELVQYEKELREIRKPPVEEPDGFGETIALLESLSLLSPVQFTDDDTPRHLVHRWTARALVEQASADAFADAHRRAAAYWRWRSDTLPQSRQQDIEDLLEARHHYHSAGELDETNVVHQQVCTQLHTWGAWQREERLIHEMLSWLPEGSAKAAENFRELGVVAHRRGDYDQALDSYRKALEIEHALGDRAGKARSYHNLGAIAEVRGDHDQALNWYRKSLEILEALGDRGGMAKSYHQLGIVTEGRGDDEQALDWFLKSLKIDEELGHRSGMAYSYGHLGNIARRRGDHEKALDWYRRCLEISESLGDRLSVANVYYSLGMVAKDHDDYSQSLDWYRKALEIREALGDRAGMADSIGQIGVLYTQRGDAADAVSFNLRSLALRLEIGSPEVRVDLYWLTRQREVLGAERFEQILREHLDEGSAANVLKALDDFAASQAQPD
jgi:tetratricopeptide (TPR) repeat protein